MTYSTNKETSLNASNRVKPVTSGKVPRLIQCEDITDFSKTLGTPGLMYKAVFYINCEHLL